MNIIDFEEYRLKKSGAPASQTATPAQPAPISAGRARLLKATRSLREAALEQYASVCKFQSITSELGDEMEKLEKSCVRLNENVGRIRIKPLRRSAVKLADTMDSFLLTRSS